MATDAPVRFRKECDCPCGAKTTETASYIHHTQAGSEVLMPAGDRPVCLMCEKEWRKVETCSREAKWRCVVCGDPMKRGEKHECSQRSVKRFEAEIRRKNGVRKSEKDVEPGYDEQLRDGFAMMGD